MEKGNIVYKCEVSWPDSINEQIRFYINRYLINEIKRNEYGVLEAIATCLTNEFSGVYTDTFDLDELFNTSEEAFVHEKYSFINSIQNIKYSSHNIIHLPICNDALRSIFDISKIKKIQICFIEASTNSNKTLKVPYWKMVELIGSENTEKIKNDIFDYGISYYDPDKILLNEYNKFIERKNNENI